jgi:hypothetical protein
MRASKKVLQGATNKECDEGCGRPSAIGQPADQNEGEGNEQIEFENHAESLSCSSLAHPIMLAQ